jgi:hypothetical protein
MANSTLHCKCKFDIDYRSFPAQENITRRKGNPKSSASEKVLKKFISRLSLPPPPLDIHGYVDI